MAESFLYVAFRLDYLNYVRFLLQLSSCLHQPSLLPASFAHESATDFFEVRHFAQLYEVRLLKEVSIALNLVLRLLYLK